MSLSRSVKDFIARLTPGQRDAEIIDAIKNPLPIATPVSNNNSVTNVLVTLAAANEDGQMVMVFNNGPDPIRILDGADPYYPGGFIVNPLGILLQMGGSWTSPVRITTAVKGITDTGDLAHCTITKYP